MTGTTPPRTPHTADGRLLVASSMATRLSGSTAVDATDKASDARQRLQNSRMDQAPVVTRGRITGWVRTSHLGGRGFVSSSMTELADSAIVSADTPIAAVLPVIARTGFAFLADDTGVVAFAVPSDFDRLAVRAHLYVLLAELEIGLSDLTRRTSSEVDIKAAFSPEQEKRFSAACAQGRETHAVEYLNLSDYAQLARNAPHFCAVIGEPIKTINRRLGEMTELRNCVAHPSKSLTGSLTATEVVAREQVAEDWLVRLRLQAA